MTILYLPYFYSLSSSISYLYQSQTTWIDGALVWPNRAFFYTLYFYILRSSFIEVYSIPHLAFIILQQDPSWVRFLHNCPNRDIKFTVWLSVQPHMITLGRKKLLSSTVTYLMPRSSQANTSWSSFISYLISLKVFSWVSSYCLQAAHLQTSEFCSQHHSWSGTWLWTSHQTQLSHKRKWGNTFSKDSNNAAPVPLRGWLGA